MIVLRSLSWKESTHRRSLRLSSLRIVYVVLVVLEVQVLVPRLFLGLLRLRLVLTRRSRRIETPIDGFITGKGLIDLVIGREPLTLDT